MSRVFASLMLAAIVYGCEVEPDQAPAPRVQLVAGGMTFTAEVASTSAAMQRGLMHRHGLAENAGMLFVLPAPTKACFWMKDTPIALSVAFIDSRGQVLNVADMEPMTETKHCAAGLASYALEVNRGLLSLAGVRAGSAIGGLPRA
jgi:uncharacterized membrane protein (UPF0127 family)